MKQKINFLLITMLFALCLSACEKQSADQADAAVESGMQSQPEAGQIEAEQTESDETESAEAEQLETDKTEREDTAPEQTAAESAEGFDIERVRKSFIIKGQPFEVPVALCDLGEGWTWEETEYSHVAPEGEGVVTLYYNGQECIKAVLENYYEGAEEQGTIYNIKIETDDCSMDGIIPCMTTKQDVVEKYGEPVELGENTGSYIYGHSRTDVGKEREQCITIRFDEDDIVMLVIINYHLITIDEH